MGMQLKLLPRYVAVADGIALLIVAGCCCCLRGDLNSCWVGADKHEPGGQGYWVHVSKSFTAYDENC